MMASLTLRTAAILTQDPVGTALCQKCNTLNIVRLSLRVSTMLKECITNLSKVIPQNKTDYAQVFVKNGKKC